MKAAESISTPARSHHHKNADAQTPFFQRKEEGAAHGSEQSFFGGSGSFFDGPEGIQAKLSMGRPGDRYEREADSVADRVVQQINTSPETTPAAPTIQRVSSLDQNDNLQEKEETHEDSAEDIQRKPIFESEGIQSKPEASSQDTSATDSLESSLGSSGAGDPLPDDTRSNMESAMGADFSGVRVHTGSDAVQMNQDLGAQAFTHGNDIYFNEGNYDTDSRDGQHLLAHELTHTVQQGASNSGVQKKDKVEEAPPQLPTHALDISTQFRPDKAWRAYLEYKKTRVSVKVRIGNTYEGVIKVSTLKRPTEAQPVKYELYNSRQYLEIKGMRFLDPLRNIGVTPVLFLNKFGDTQRTTGYISFSKHLTRKETGVIKTINDNLETLDFTGLDAFSLKGITVENEFENGRLRFSINGLQTQIDNYISASGGIGISGEHFTFELNADVTVPGVTQGQFTLKRLETGKLEGRAELSADIANVNAVVVVEYLSGEVSIQGTGTINSEKFTGSVSFLVTDRKRADETMRSELGVQQVEQESASTPPKNARKKPEKEVKKSPKNQVLVGWGTVTATITPWLEGTAKIGIDSKGHVTMVGDIVMPNEVPLIDKEYGKKITIVDFKLKAGYGVPLVGQVYLFAGINLFINAGFGPLILKDVGLKGTYSTDPKILQNFTISGTLAINAFAILGLRAEGGVGLTLIGHDIEAGIGVTAAAGLRAYAEATPIFEYVEKAGPAGGKVGEAWLKGHFEAAAQLFLQLSGDFFVELDSPWWSPAPDKKWTYPMGSVDYPIGDSMGIGADVAWLVGSPELPELKFSPVEFDPAKFTKDVMADPPPGGGKGGEKKGDGKWEDQSKKDDKQASPETKEGKGLPGKKKEDLTKLPDEQRYMRGLEEIGDLGDRAKNSPITEKVLAAKLRRVKAKYALNTVKIDGKKDGEATVYVKHKAQNNSKNKVKVKLMSEKMRMLLLQKAASELQAALKAKAGEKNTISESDAKAVAVAVQKKNSLVIESILVQDGVKSWDFMVDLGDTTKKWPGMAKSDAPEDAKGDPNQNKDLTPEEKQKRVNAGLKALKDEEKQYLDKGAITEEEANKVVIKVRKIHPVFVVLKVMDGGDTWDYYYEASKGNVDLKTPKDFGENGPFRNEDKALQLIKSGQEVNIHEDPPDGYHFRRRPDGYMDVQRNPIKKDEKNERIPLFPLALEQKPPEKSKEQEEGQEGGDAIIYVYTKRKRKPSQRLAQSGKLAKNMGLTIRQRENHQAHHVIPDQVWRKTKFMNLVMKYGYGQVDEARNGLRMPANEAGQSITNLPIHRGSHGTYNGEVMDELNFIYSDLVRDHGSEEKIPASEIKDLFSYAYNIYRKLSASKMPRIK